MDDESDIGLVYEFRWKVCGTKVGVS